MKSTFYLNSGRGNVIALLSIPMVSLRSKGMDRNAERSKAKVPIWFYRDVQAEYRITNTYRVHEYLNNMHKNITEVGYC